MSTVDLSQPKFDVFRALSQKFNTPKKVQTFLNTFTYNQEPDGETVKSALETYHSKNAHCLEATVLSAAILEHHGYAPLMLSIDSKDHLCHAIYIFKERTGWGAISRSREIGLHGRAPRFRSIRDLAMSFYDPYVDDTSKMIGYVPLKLEESQTDWRFSKRNLWKLEQFVVNSKHIKVKSSRERYERLKENYLKNGQITSGPHWW